MRADAVFYVVLLEPTVAIVTSFMQLYHMSRFSFMSGLHLGASFPSLCLMAA